MKYKIYCYISSVYYSRNKLVFWIYTEPDVCNLTTVKSGSIILENELPLPELYKFRDDMCKELCNNVIQLKIKEVEEIRSAINNL